MATITEPHLAPPSRYRGRVGIAILLIALALGPLAWLAQLLVVYAIASHACYPDGAPLLAAARAGFQWVLLAINLAGIVLAAIAGLISFRNYRAARHVPDRSEIATRIEGRAEFFAGWGGLAGFGFFVAALFDLIALIAVPPCLG